MPDNNKQSLTVPILPNALPLTQKLIDLIANPNLTTKEIDEQMGWHEGETRRLIARCPALMVKANEARILAFKLVGLEAPRLGAYKAIKEGLEATKRLPDGSDDIDHKIRLEAAQKILNILGDDLPPPVINQTNNFYGDMAEKIETYKLMTVEELESKALEFMSKGRGPSANDTRIGVEQVPNNDSLRIEEAEVKVPTPMPEFLDEI